MSALQRQLDLAQRLRHGSAAHPIALDAQRQIRLARQASLKAQAEARMNLAEIERILGEDL